jgi:radical SAM protein with 4Fe4S-binding SPASM domain
MIKKLKIKLNSFLKEISYNNRKIKAYGQPLVFAIEITNRCNLKCIMCPRTTMMKRKIGDMNFNLFKKIVNETGKYTPFIWLHDFGEPLLHPKIMEMIKYAKSRGIRVGISVNAKILNEEMSKRLIQTGLDHIIFSFDGFSKKTYEKYRAGANFEVVKQNILNFLKIKKELKSKLPYVQIKMINMKDTNKEIEDFKKEWTGKANEVLITQFIDWAGQIENKENLDGAILERQKYPCKWFWIGFVVLWDGRVVPCCKDCDGKLVFGNLNNQTLKEIWNSPKFIGLRKQQIKGNFNNQLCNNCHEAIGKPNLFFPLEIFKNKLKGDKV